VVGQNLTISRPVYDLVLALSLGTLTFIYVSGGTVINPLNTDWLMFGDAAQHYLGWEFFRHTPMLQWPLGANYPLGMELSSSIVFTDSIPVAAYISKILSPILPVTFQYLGIWIWICFFLQAYFAVKILRVFLCVNNHVYLGSFFLVFSPPLIYRLIHAGHGHIALASHWLILAAIYLYLIQKTNDGKWTILIALSWLIQAYFAPMVIAIWIASLIRRLILREHLLGLTKSIAVTSLTSFFVMWSSGYFMLGKDFNPDGWNYVFRWQPLSFVDSGTNNSTGWSFMLPDRAQLDGATEAFSFLGSGVLLLMTISLIPLLKNLKLTKIHTLLSISIGSILVFATIYLSLPISKIISVGALLVVVFFSGNLVIQILSVPIKYIPLLGAVTLLAIYSMTNHVVLAQKTLFEYPLFFPLRQFTETFRTHGRSIWPFYYVLIIGSVVYFAQNFKKKFVVAVLTSMIVFQLIDSAPAINSARTRFMSVEPWETPMRDSRWDELAQRSTSILVVPPLNDDSEELWIAIDDFAIANNLSTNSGNFSRSNDDQYNLINQQLINSLKFGTVKDTNLVIVEDPELWSVLTANSKDFYFIGIIDGFRVVSP
jgi:hypothetical protein